METMLEPRWIGSLICSALLLMPALGVLPGCGESGLTSTETPIAETGALEGNPWSFDQVKNVDHALLIETGFDASGREALQAAMTSLGVRVSWLSDRSELTRVLESLTDQSRVFSVRKGPGQDFFVSEGFEDSIPGLTTRVNWVEDGQMRSRSFELNMY